MDKETFDLAHFAMMTGNDNALQVEIVGIFSTQAALWIRLLIPDAPTGVWTDAAHTVKGSARGLGLWSLAEACDRAERLGRAGAVEGALVKEALDRVRMELTAALDALTMLNDTSAAA